MHTFTTIFAVAVLVLSQSLECWSVPVVASALPDIPSPSFFVDRNGDVIKSLSNVTLAKLSVSKLEATDDSLDGTTADSGTGNDSSTSSSSDSVAIPQDSKLLSLMQSYFGSNSTIDLKYNGKCYEIDEGTVFEAIKGVSAVSSSIQTRAAQKSKAYSNVVSKNSTSSSSPTAASAGLVTNFFNSTNFMVSLARESKRVLTLGAPISVKVVFSLSRVNAGQRWQINKDSWLPIFSFFDSSTLKLQKKNSTTKKFESVKLKDNWGFEATSLSNGGVPATQQLTLDDSRNVSISVSLTSIYNLASSGAGDYKLDFTYTPRSQYMCVVTLSQAKTFSPNPCEWTASPIYFSVRASAAKSKASKQKLRRTLSWGSFSPSSLSSFGSNWLSPSSASAGSLSPSSGLSSLSGGNSLWSSILGSSGSSGSSSTAYSAIASAFTSGANSELASSSDAGTYLQQLMGGQSSSASPSSSSSSTSKSSEKGTTSTAGESDESDSDGSTAASSSSDDGTTSKVKGASGSSEATNEGEDSSADGKGTSNSTPSSSKTKSTGTSKEGSASATSSSSSTVDSKSSANSPSSGSSSSDTSDTDNSDTSDTGSVSTSPTLGSSDGGVTASGTGSNGISSGSTLDGSTGSSGSSGSNNSEDSSNTDGLSPTSSATSSDTLSYGDSTKENSTDISPTLGTFTYGVSQGTCTEDQKAVLQRVIYEYLIMLSGISKVLLTYNVCGTTFTRAFRDVSNFDYVSNVFYRMNATSYIRFNCGDPNNQLCVQNASSAVLAFTYPDDTTKTIYLCDAFWNWDLRLAGTNEGMDSMSSTIVHELTHHTDIGSTIDIAYGNANVQKLDDNQSIDNADNYAYYADLIWETANPSRSNVISK